MSLKFEQICINCMREKPSAGEVCPYCGFDPSAYKPKDHWLLPFTVLRGKYLIGRVVGQGGFGIVYAACDMTLETKVAVKELFPSNMMARTHVGAGSRPSSQVTYTESPQFIDELKKKFTREARALSALQRSYGVEGIVTVLDLFSENGTEYMVMEYLEGKSLLSYLKEKENRAISWEEALDLLRPCMESLEIIHQNGIIHRDISPDNLIILNRNKKVKLLDFGNLKVQNPDSRLAATSTVVAVKKGYTPIEQYSQNGNIGAWTDVYAMAATIYRCITGRVPPEPMDVARDGIPKPSDLGIVIPARLEEVLMQALAIYPENRIRDMSELMSGLYGAASGGKESAGFREDYVSGFSERIDQQSSSQAEGYRVSGKPDEYSGKSSPAGKKDGESIRDSGGSKKIIIIAVSIAAAAAAIGVLLWSRHERKKTPMTELSVMSETFLPESQTLQVNESETALKEKEAETDPKDSMRDSEKDKEIESETLPGYLKENQEASEQELQAASEKASEAETQAASEKASEAETQEASEKASEAGTQAASEKASEAESQAASEKASEAESQAASEKASEAESQAASEKASEAESQAASEKASEAESQAASEKASEAESQEASEKASEAESQEASEKASEAESQAASEKASEAESQATSEKASEAESQALSEKASEAESQAASEAESQATSEKASEAESQALSEKASEVESQAASEKASEAESQEASEEAARQPEFTEVYYVSLNSPEPSTDRVQVRTPDGMEIMNDQAQGDDGLRRGISYAAGTEIAVSYTFYAGLNPMQLTWASINMYQPGATIEDSGYVITEIGKQKNLKLENGKEADYFTVRAEYHGYVTEVTDLAVQLEKGSAFITDTRSIENEEDRITEDELMAYAECISEDDD